jgi:DNA-binding CsgD family transcriptional regulator
MDKMSNEEESSVTSPLTMTEEMRQMLDGLTEREREIIKLYFGIDHDNAYTFEEIGRKLKITGERARQIKNKALNRLKTSLEVEVTPRRKQKQIDPEVYVNERINKLMTSNRDAMEAYQDLMSSVFFSEILDKILDPLDGIEHDEIKSYLEDFNRLNVGDIDTLTDSQRIVIEKALKKLRQASMNNEMIKENIPLLRALFETRGLFDLHKGFQGRVIEFKDDSLKPIKL